MTRRKRKSVFTINQTNGTCFKIIAKLLKKDHVVQVDRTNLYDLVAIMYTDQNVTVVNGSAGLYRVEGFDAEKVPRMRASCLIILRRLLETI